jgi:hypothetical protein
MAKLQDWDVYCVNPYLATMIHHAKSITSDGMEVKEVSHQLSDYALNTTGEIPVFTALESNSKLAMELTSKPYLNAHGNY